MKRGLLAIGLGIVFLIAITWLGTVITSIIPHRPTAQVQTIQAGPYSVTLQVNPNPPPITQRATLSIKVQQSVSQQPITNAHVTIDSNMEDMDMGTEQVEARSQGDGTYLAHVQFSMSGAWQIQVIITSPGAPAINAVFEVVTS